MANPYSQGQIRAKPFREALNMERLALEAGEIVEHPPGSLRWIAQRALLRAGTETAAMNMVADRLDGKVPQAIVGDDEHAPVRVEDEASTEWRAKCVAVLLAAAKLGKPDE